MLYILRNLIFQNRNKNWFFTFLTEFYTDARFFPLQVRIAETTPKIRRETKRVKNFVKRNLARYS